MSRKIHSTTIEDRIWNDFKNKVKRENRNINDVLEELMKHYINEDYIAVIKKINNI